MRFADVKLILEVCGWEEDRSTGHIQFVKPGYRTLPVQVKDGKVGFHVLKQIKRAIA